MVLEQTHSLPGDMPYYPPPQGQWRYQDYLQLPDNEFRYQILYGDLYMSLAPLIQHQRVIFALIKHFASYLDQYDAGEALPAPIDVNLPLQNSVVQPDLLFVAKERLAIIQERVVAGAPDLVVEIISPNSLRQDRQIKYQIYAEAGVREYWLIGPKSCTVEIYVLRGQAYALLGKFSPGDKTYSELLPNFSIAVNDICSAKR